MFCQKFREDKRQLILPFFLFFAVRICTLLLIRRCRLVNTSDSQTKSLPLRLRSNHRYGYPGVGSRYILYGGQLLREQLCSPCCKLVPLPGRACPFSCWDTPACSGSAYDEQGVSSVFFDAPVLPLETCRLDGNLLPASWFLGCLSSLHHLPPSFT